MGCLFALQGNWFSSIHCDNISFFNLPDEGKRDGNIRVVKQLAEASALEIVGFIHRRVSEITQVFYKE